MSIQKKDTFILRLDFYPQIKMLSREQRGDLLTAIFAYSIAEEMPQMDDITRMCFGFIKASLDANSERYQAKCEQNRENGSRGGRPRKPNGFNENRPVSEESERLNGKPGGKPENPIEFDSDTDSDSGFDGDTSTHTPVDSEGGIIRGDDRQKKAAALLRWVAGHCPSVAALPHPLNDQQAIWMLNKYDIRDVRRILAEMENHPKICEKEYAYTTFSSFTKYDPILKERRTATDRLYTYEQMCGQIPARARSTDFERTDRLGADGKPLWRLTK